MKKIIYIMAVASLTINAEGLYVIESGKADNVMQEKALVSAESTNGEMTKQYKKVIIKDGGSEYPIQVEIKKKVTAKSQVSTTQNENVKDKTLDKLNSKVGIMLKFKMHTIDIADIELRFNIKLKIKLSTEYYIFENASVYTDLELIEQLLTSNLKNKLEVARPNWPGEAVPM